MNSDVKKEKLSLGWCLCLSLPPAPPYHPPPLPPSSSRLFISEWGAYAVLFSYSIVFCHRPSSSVISLSFS